MNIYLLTFKQGNRVINAWHEASNAGEAIDLIEDKGIDVIRTIKIRNVASQIDVKRIFPDLLFWLSLLETDIRYQELQLLPKLEELVKIIL